jgi:phytoene dehydrogenase-like protein
MGGPAWNHLYAHYAVARFGEDPRRLAASAARHVHGVPSPLAPVLAGGPAEAPYAQAVALIESAGGEIRSNQRPVRIVVEGGKISAVELADGSSIPTGGPLWCTLPAAVLLPLLGDAVLPTSQSDAAFLQVRDHVVAAPKHAGGGPAHVKHIGAHRVQVEHAVEAGHLVHLDALQPEHSAHAACGHAQIDAPAAAE